MGRHCMSRASILGWKRAMIYRVQKEWMDEECQSRSLRAIEPFFRESAAREKRTTA